MKILIFGGTGMLGHKLVQVLGRRFEVWAACREITDEFMGLNILEPGRLIEKVEVTDEVLVADALDSVRPNVVINAVGVIKQLPSSRDVTTALTINSLFPHRLAELSGRFGFRLITISTDCVFDGKTGNYSETDVPDALDLYGQSKRWGEVHRENCLTIRTSIIGHELGTRHSLVDLFLGNRGGQVKGFTHAVYSGFPTVVFADILGDLIMEHPSLSGLYHISSEPISKYELLKLINTAYDANIAVEPSDEVRIDRSLDSGRFRSATAFEPEPWPEMILRMRADASIYRRFDK